MLLNRSQLFACSLFSWVLYFSLSSLSSAVLAATWSATGRMITARTGLTATMLPDGEVLVAGGAENHNDNPAFNSAELYNPSTGVWSATGSMIGARAWHNATLLHSGKVLVAGGWNNGDALSSAEIYDPATRAWTATGPLTTARQGGGATLLLDGRVLVAGGAGPNPPTYTLASAEIYDPATGSWSATGSMTTARRTNPATLLPNGKVLVAGGMDGKSVFLASAEIYDPATEVWTTTGSMTTVRGEPATVLLSTGRVLVTGGFYNFNGDSLASAELFRINSALVPSFIMPFLLSE